MKRWAAGFALMVALVWSGSAQAAPWKGWVVDLDRMVAEVAESKAAVAKLDSGSATFAAEREKALGPIRERVADYVIDLAERNQVRWVFVSEEVAYAKKKFDVTSELIKLYDKRSAAKK